MLACGVQVNLSNNQLCGLDRYGRGKYTAEGIKALADAVSVSASLTDLNISFNDIGAEGATSFAKALHGNASLTKVLAFPRLNRRPANSHFPQR